MSVGVPTKVDLTLHGFTKIFCTKFRLPVFQKVGYPFAYFLIVCYSSFSMHHIIFHNYYFLTFCIMIATLIVSGYAKKYALFEFPSPVEEIQG